MARPASVVMSAADKKAAIKELKGQIRTIKTDGKVVEKEFATVTKAFNKGQKARQKTLAGLEAKLQKLSV